MLPSPLHKLLTANFVHNKFHRARQEAKLITQYVKSFFSAMILFIVVNQSAYADMAGYDGVVTISAQTDTVLAEHHHDWSATTHDARWKMISTTENPFTEENNYSVLTLRDKKTGAELFHKPVPALTYIWVSPDSNYVVGVSNIMLWNPYQLVVFDKNGNRLLEKNLVNVQWPGVSQSVTNWIKWYKEPTPKISVRHNKSNKFNLTLVVEDAAGTMREFEFKAAH